MTARQGTIAVGVAIDEEDGQIEIVVTVVDDDDEPISYSALTPEQAMKIGGALLAMAHEASHLEGHLSGLPHDERVLRIAALIDQAHAPGN